jgi:hypothetical protein
MTEPDEIAAWKQEQAEAEAPDPLEETLAVYPLRDPSQDPGWAVKVVWTWICIAVFLLLFFVVLLVLGLWYD